MRRPFVLALLLAGLTGSTAQAQDWARKMFTDVTHDFGTVARDAKAEYHFVFTNIYQEPVHVVGVRTSCGCTDPSVTKNDLKTFEKSEIVAKFNTRAFTGQHQATLTVTIDKPFFAEVQLFVSGNIRGEIVVRPEQVAFGSVDQGTEVERRLTITHNAKPDWKIVDVRSINSNYEVEVVDGPRRGGQASYDLVVKLKKDAPPGYVSDQLILVTNDRNAPQFPIEVEGLVNAELTASPQAISFGAVEVGHKAIKPIVVRSRKPFKVTDIKCEDGSFTFKLPEDAKTVQPIAITFTAPNKPGPIVQKLKIETDLGKTFTAEVVAQAEVKPSSEPVAADDAGDKPAADKTATDSSSVGPQKPIKPVADKPATDSTDKPAVDKGTNDKTDSAPPVTEKAPIKRRADKPATESTVGSTAGQATGRRWLFNPIRQ